MSAPARGAASLDPDDPSSGGPSEDSPLHAFRGPIKPTPVSLLYKAGLIVVACAMVLLPAIYVALIVVVAWGVAYHLANNTVLMSGSGGATIHLILYLGPAVVGGTLVVFMVKPFFARRPKRPEQISLDPLAEPVLFAFIERICGLVCAPVPARVEVDNQVNASARLRRGFLSKDLVLTIGLPLAGGLDMRQFAGVLAHEFGHFAQGAGMRLTYIVRNINFWFARVVYERDQWDLRLESSAKSVDIRLGIVLHTARGCIWLTRRLLWALMHAGHAISCFMLRQMEYDADSYEAKVAGSDSFATTAERLQLLNVATQGVYEDVRQSWTSKRLPENLAFMIQHKTRSLPTDLREKIRAHSAALKTGTFDTHPCDADRTRAVRALNEPGVFRLEEPAVKLFSDFEQLGKTVTRHQYEKEFELLFTDANVVSSDQVVQESQATAEADAALRQVFGKVSCTLKPVLLDDISLPLAEEAPAPLAAWKLAQADLERLRPEAERLSAEWADRQAKLLNFTAAHQLSRAGFRLSAQGFALPENVQSVHDQEIAAKGKIDEVSAELTQISAQLDAFFRALSMRLSAGLQLLHSPEVRVRLTQAEELSREAQEFRQLLARLNGNLPLLQETIPQFHAFQLLLQNRPNHAKPESVDAEIHRLAIDLQETMGRLQQQLAKVPYPFPHARGDVSVAEYARPEKPSEHAWEAAFQVTNAHLERLFALHHRVLGRLLVILLLVEQKADPMRPGECERRN